MSNPIVRDSDPIDVNAPVEKVLKSMVEKANGPFFVDKEPLTNEQVMSMEII